MILFLGEERALEDQVKKLFEDRLPVELFKKDERAPMQPEKEKESKKEAASDTTEEAKSTPLNNNIMSETREEKKFDDVSGTLNDSSYEYDKKKETENLINKKKREIIEKDLDQKIYITLSETNTNFMYFTPCLKYFPNKNEVKEKQEKEKEEFFNQYKNKLKNHDSFAKRSTQTLNKFKRTQIISTSSLKDQESDTHANQRVNALCWNIVDSYHEERNKKDDDGKRFQKRLERKIKKELKEKLKKSEFIFNIEESESMLKSQLTDETSVLDSKLSSSIPSSRRPRPRIGNVTDTTDKSMMESRSKNTSSPSNSTRKLNQGISDQSGKGHQGNEEEKKLTLEIPNSIINPLRFVERLLAQNQFHFRQIAYKNYPFNEKEFTAKKEIKSNPIQGFEFKAEAEDNQNSQEEMFKQEIELVQNIGENPDMKYLFTFSGKGIFNDSSTPYIVHSLDWNPVNKDLLAAGYGDPDIDSKKEGLLCFWTLKNPRHPERVIFTPRGITSCNFSNKNPFYIVASDYAGEVMVYDLRVNNNKPVADSTELKDKHSDIVWEAKWVERMNDKNEIIVSISSDGKVKEWSLKKGLEVTDLMRLRKNVTFPNPTLSPFSKYDKTSRTTNKESLIFRDANGLSFDFPKNDSTIYYVSLEECTLHRCRISYKDQYTDTYYGHQGPAFKVRCNPYDPNILISCSYDWTVKIWNSKQMYPLINCYSKNLIHQVNDIEWSPFTSTIFGCVADDGRIEIWDLSQQTIDPVIRWKPSNPSKINIPKKCIKFSKSSQVIASGDSDFDIDVFRLYNLKHVEVGD